MHELETRVSVNSRWMIIYGKYRKHELLQSTLGILLWMLLFQSKGYEVLITSTILEP